MQKQQSVSYRHDLRIKEDNITQLCPDINEENLAKCLRTVHIYVVAKAINACQNSVVLGGHPPPISQDEKFLPRNTRATLSQLRSGLCCYLEIVDICPLCAYHETSLRMSQKTHLIPLSLWTNPVDADLQYPTLTLIIISFLTKSIFRSRWRSAFIIN